MRLRQIALLLTLCLAGAPVWAATVSFGPASGLRAAPGGDVVVPVLVDPAQGVDTLALEFHYDPVVLSPVSAYRTAATDAFTLTEDLATAGVVGLTLGSATPLGSAAAEEVVWVLFDVVGAGAGPTDLTWSGAEINGGAIAATTEDASVSVIASGSVFSIADDALVALGGTTVVSVDTTDATGAESIDLIVRHNPEVVVPIDVEKTTLSAPMSLNFYLGIPGQTRISLFQIGQLAGSGPVVTIEYQSVGALGEQTPLDISKGIINEGAIPTTVDDGLIAICDPLDADLDGISGCDGDCDDANADVYPGAPEICDGLDNQCPGDPGHGEVDEGFDADGDGTADCFDGCPDDPLKTAPGQCGCNEADVDTDEDTVADCVDNCPAMPNPLQEDDDGDQQGNVCDCAPLDPTDSPPVEVDDSLLAGKTGGVVELSWDVEGLPDPFRLHRGSRAAGAGFVYDHVCVGGPIAGGAASDATAPSDGETLYYLVGRENACGESGLGQDGDGAARPGGTLCS